MAVRIDNFEHEVESVIVQRGRRYYRSGAVTKCTEEDGEVRAEVQGSENYRVRMEIDDDGTIGSHRCSCPYDYGEFCKHEVAVLYYLRDMRKKAAHKAEVEDIVADLKQKAENIKLRDKSEERKDKSLELREVKSEETNRWEMVLEGLMRAANGNDEETKGKKGKKSTKIQQRLVYVMEKYGEDYSVIPRKQKLCTDGSWSQPYNVSAQTYFTTGYDFMDDRDRQIFERLRKTVGHTKYYYRPNWGRKEDYLPFLADTDKVLLQKWNGEFVPVSVRKERAYLSIERQGDELVLASNVKMSKYVYALTSPCVVKESETSFVVIELSEFEQKAYSALLKLGPIPAAGEAKLKEFITAVSSRIEVHSDLIEGGSTLEHVRGEATIVLRLAPRHGSFEMSCSVQPLRGGKLRFFPGEGKTVIFDEKEGVRYQVERDIETETVRFQILSDFAESELNILLANEAQTIEIEDVLRLMEFVGEHQNEHQNKGENATENEEVYAIEWLEGAKVSIKQAANEDTYSMGLRTKQNWFEVEGELQLDEKTILSAAELLKLMQANMVGKRFVRLNDTEFLALNERLAKQLSSVQQLAQVRKNSVVIPRYEIGLLGELMANPQTILREDKGVKTLLEKIDRAAQMTIEVPKELQATLRAYQEDGYRWMMRLAEWGAGACLADDMGLGKTVQTIAVLLARAKKGASLVVAPASVVYNWQNEILRFAPTLNVHVFNEADDRAQLIEMAGNYDVVLTTYGLLVREAEMLAGKAWNVVCLDEAHTIKNRATKMSQAAMSLKAGMRIALTGTPLQNYLSELWNLFQQTASGLAAEDVTAVFAQAH